MNIIVIQIGIPALPVVAGGGVPVEEQNVRGIVMVRTDVAGVR